MADTVFARITGHGLDAARARFTAQARLIVMLVKAAAMQPQQEPELRANLTALVLRTIDRTLDEVVASALKG